MIITVKIEEFKEEMYKGYIKKTQVHRAQKVSI